MNLEQDAEEEIDEKTSRDLSNDRRITIYSMLLHMSTDGNLKYGDLTKVASDFNVH